MMHGKCIAYKSFDLGTKHENLEGWRTNVIEMYPGPLN